MDRLSRSDQAFIRPSPTSGDLGGVARRTRETIALCEAAGFDRILVETVGVGQSELEVDQLSDLTLLLMIAGAGDELQGIKRGIMESADLVALTKLDADPGDRARVAIADLRNALMLMPPRPSGRMPEVMGTSAVSGTGVAELCARLEALHAEDRANGYLHRRRHDQNLNWMRHAIQDGLLRAFKEDARVQRAMTALEADVRDGSRSPLAAAEELLALFRTGGAPLP